MASTAAPPWGTRVRVATTLSQVAFGARRRAGQTRYKRSSSPRAFGVAAVASARAPRSKQGGGVRRDRGTAGCDRERDCAGDGDHQAVDLQHDAGGVERGELDRVTLPGGQQGVQGPRGGVGVRGGAGGELTRRGCWSAANAPAISRMRLFALTPARRLPWTRRGRQHRCWPCSCFRRERACRVARPIASRVCSRG